MVDKALDELLARKNSELIAGQSDSIGDSKLEAYKGLKDSLEEGLVAASRGTTVPSVAPRPAVTPPSQKQRPRSQMSMNNEDNKSEGQMLHFLRSSNSSSHCRVLLLKMVLPMEQDLVDLLYLRMRWRGRGM